MNKGIFMRQLCAVGSAALIGAGMSLPVFADTTNAAAPPETTITETTAETIVITTTTPDPLTRITYEETETGIRLTRFAWTNEDTVTIPDKISGKPVTEIGAYAFQYCYADSVILPDTVTVIGEQAFAGCAYLKEFTVPAQCTAIGYRAFAECEQLQTVNIPETVTEIGYSAFESTPFYQNNSDEFVVLGGGVLYAYKGSAETAVIPDTVRAIGAYAFADQQQLRSVTIPDSVTQILTGAFENCTALEEIRPPATLEKLSADAFVNTKWMTDNAADYRILGDVLVAYRGENTAAEVPEGVRVINESAFEGNTALTSVKLPDSVTEIRRAAFYGCTSLQVVMLGEHVTAIGDMAFFNCATLRYLRVGHSLTEIGKYAFAGCPNLTEVYLPDSVAAVGTLAFGYAWSLEQSQYEKTDAALILYANAEAVRTYAAAEDITCEPLPEEENTEPVPEVTTNVQIQSHTGEPRGSAWIPAAVLGGVLVLTGLISLLLRGLRRH